MTQVMSNMFDRNLIIVYKEISLASILNMLWSGKSVKRESKAKIDNSFVGVNHIIINYNIHLGTIHYNNIILQMLKNTYLET